MVQPQNNSSDDDDNKYKLDYCLSFINTQQIINAKHDMDLTIQQEYNKIHQIYKDRFDLFDKFIKMQQEDINKMEKQYNKLRMEYQFNNLVFVFTIIISLFIFVYCK